MARKKKTAHDLLIGVVADESGSMGWARQDTCDGFNRLVEDQQAVDGSRAFVSLVTFNNTIRVPLVAVDVHEVPALGSEANPYMPNGGTALYDAVITMIQGLDAWLANHPSFGGKVLVSIFTDGQNNASQNTLASMNAMISDRQAAGWTFDFLGSGGAAWTEGENFRPVPVANFARVAASPAGVTSSYMATSTSATQLRSTGVTAGAAMNYAAAMTANTSTAADESASKKPLRPQP